jgi:cold shock protein
MSSIENVVTPGPAESLIGRVKWFNNKAGYGFITVTDGSRSGTDVFVHHSTIQVENQQYKYLVQGEYVEFDLIKTSSGAHEWQASNVHGIKGGKLMCETRNETKQARTAYKSVSTTDETIVPRPPREPSVASTQTRQPRSRGEGPREGENKVWTLVSTNGAERPVRESDGRGSGRGVGRGLGRGVGRGAGRGKPRAPRQSVDSEQTK